MKKLVFCITVAIMAASCSDNPKKILVLTRGKAIIDKEGKSIVATEQATNHEEQTIEYNTGDKVTLQVKSQAGDATVEVA
jgi:ribosomal protein S17